MMTKESLLKQFNRLDGRIKKIGDSQWESYSGRLFVDREMFAQWRAQVITLLSQIYRPSFLSKILSDPSVNDGNRLAGFQSLVGVFKAAYEDFNNGMLSDLQAEVEGQISVDFLQQAEALLDERSEVDYSYIPAAVLAGAVIEKSLRTLCARQDPAIDVNNENGKAKKAQRLLDDLKKASVFTPVEAKQIESWLAIRNSAAHGKNDEFTRNDVASMIRGITDFLAKHMG